MQNQAYGYLFPHGTFFGVGDLLSLPGWVTQRLWWALLLVVGVVGVVRLAEALGIGSMPSRLIAATAYALSPRVLTTLGSISSETWAMMLAPWVLLPVVRVLGVAGGGPAPGGAGVSVRRAAARSAVAVALMGAVNATATLAACLPALLWLLCHRPDRRWWRFTGWWALCLVPAVAWWVIALLLLGRVSPPFLDYIESSGVTVQWTSLTEVLRGTDSWTPFVAPAATGGSTLVTGWVAVLATALVAAAGLAGLAAPTRLPVRGRLVVLLLTGVTLLAVGYAATLGSPLAGPVRAFLDGAGAPLRNVHKLEPLVRLPLVLGLAHLLGRVPLPGAVRREQWRTALAHPERDRRVAVTVVLLAALLTATSLAWTGRLAAPGAYTAIPQHWRDAAAWLDTHNTGDPVRGRVLVVPGAPFATQVWGTTRDEPLQVLGESPWGVRDSIPLTPPATIRALDSVQRLFAAGRPSAGLADTLARQGVTYLVVRNDLDPATSRSARPLLVHRAVDGSPGLTEVARFGDPTGPGELAGFVTDSGLRPRYPAVQIYRVDGRAGHPSGPSLVDADAMARVDGAPEAFARLDERRRLTGRPPLGPALLTDDALAAGLAAPLVTVTDTPADRETDYGRVDDHSSAIRADGDRRTTFNRVPDYPVSTQGGPADLVRGVWEGGRVSVSSSAADATALPSVAPAAAATGAVDADPATGWVSNALQAAVGQWLQVDFDRSVTSATMTLVVAATAVGPQVRRLQVATAGGTTTVRVDRPGVPITVALPRGESPWVRVTAIATADGSPGVQFGITELAVTQYDASGFAFPVQVRHSVEVPGAPAGSAVAAWDLGIDLPGRPGCADGPDDVRCAATMALTPEQPVNLSRILDLDTPTPVTAAVWLRPRPGPALADLIRAPGAVRAEGDADLADPQGSAYAVADGDPRTSWVAPQRLTADGSPATVTLRLPRPTEVTGVRLTPPTGPLPARPTRVTIDAGAGPQTVTVPGRDDRRSGSPADPLDVPLVPVVTDTVTVTVTAWRDVIDRTAIGFDQLKPPGLAEVTVLGADGPVADPGATSATANATRRVRLPCGEGPVIGAAGRFVQTSVDTTVAALLAGAPIAARPCDPAPIVLPAGRQEVVVSPGEAFTVDGAVLATPRADEVPTAAPTPAEVIGWDAAHREVALDGAPRTRVLVVPESVNPGWVAQLADGTALRAVTVDGWQQGFVVPAGAAGTATLTFAPNRAYRWGLFGGLALLPVLAAAALLPARRLTPATSATTSAAPWAPARAAAAGTVVVGALIAGPVGAAAGAAALGLRRWARRRPTRGRRWAMLAAAGGMTLAGALLSRGPWRSVDGYAGHSPGVQLAALGALLAVAVAALPSPRRRSQARSDRRAGSSTSA